MLYSRNISRIKRRVTPLWTREVLRRFLSWVASVYPPQFSTSAVCPKGWTHVGSINPPPCPWLLVGFSQVEASRRGEDRRRVRLGICPRSSLTAKVSWVISFPLSPGRDPARTPRHRVTQLPTVVLVTGLSPCHINLEVVSAPHCGSPQDTASSLSHFLNPRLWNKSLCWTLPRLLLPCSKESFLSTRDLKR